MGLNWLPFPTSPLLGYETGAKSKMVEQIQIEKPVIFLIIFEIHNQSECSHANKIAMCHGYHILDFYTHVYSWKPHQITYHSNTGVQLP